MTQCRINVEETNGKVTSVDMQIALGPWPMKNWSHDWVFFRSDLDAARNAKAFIESLPDHLGQEAFFMMSAQDVPDHVTEAEVREHYERRLREEASKRSYTIE